MTTSNWASGVAWMMIKTHSKQEMYVHPLKLGKILEKGNGNTLQYSFVSGEISRTEEPNGLLVNGITKNQTGLITKPPPLQTKLVPGSKIHSRRCPDISHTKHVLRVNTNT